MNSTLTDKLHPLVLELHQPVGAALLFGSVARKTNTIDSDIDVLQLVPQQTTSYKVGRLAVSVYTESALQGLARQGSLFVLHLKLEGKILFDPKNLMQNCLEKYMPPQSYDPLLTDLKALANLLDGSKEEYFRRWITFNGMAVFILRSALFAKFASENRPCFSMADIAEALNDQSILIAHGLKNSTSPNYLLFEKTRNLIEIYLSTSIKNTLESFDALILKQSQQSDFLKFVGLHFLKKNTDVEAYGFFKSLSDGR